MYKYDFVRQLDTKGGDRRQNVLHIDFTLLIILLVLCMTGLFVLYSASEQSLYYVKRQATFMMTGFTGMLIVRSVPGALLGALGCPFFTALLFSFDCSFVFWVELREQLVGLILGLLGFQPSEIAKIAVPMMVSAYLSRRLIPPKLKHVAGALLIVGIPALLIIRQPDLGTSILVFTSGFSFCFWRV
jgi:rod shape determining protein RodA